MTLKAFLKNPIKKTIIALNHSGLLRWIPDKLFLPMYYRVMTGKHLHLKAPVTFNEKLQWLKLHNRKPIYTKMVDKYAAKKYVSQMIGDEYVIPTLGVWNSVEDVPFDTLPNRFVLKCTHDSGGLVVCKDKSQLDIAAAKKKISRCLKRNYYSRGREWPYKNVPPRIIAEQYMEDESGELKDYKIFCFDGEPKLIQLDFDRFASHKRNMYSPEWERLDMLFKYPGSETDRFNKPAGLSEMLYLAKELSKGHPFLRVDFYSVCGKIYFGELTFYPESGFSVFEPDKWNDILGSWIRIS